MGFAVWVDRRDTPLGPSLRLGPLPPARGEEKRGRGRVRGGRDNAAMGFFRVPLPSSGGDWLWSRDVVFRDPPQGRVSSVRHRDGDGHPQTVFALAATARRDSRDAPLGPSFRAVGTLRMTNPFTSRTSGYTRDV